jgi:LmbE family N-acetylglucosaminyl deacetylase
LGFTSAADYAAARRRESLSALARLNVPPDQCIALSFPDQELHLNLAAAAKKLQQLVERFRPEWVLTHSYEGGHPDHDSACALAHALRARSLFNLLEFPLYRAGPNQEEIFGQFLQCEAAPDPRWTLTAEEREFKRELLVPFVSQSEIVERFPLDKESLRSSPEYNFLCPPHSGQLLYERWGLGAYARWHACVRRLLEEQFAAELPGHIANAY